MKHTLLPLLLTLLSFCSLSAQSIGEWFAYPSTGTMTAVEDTGDEVFALAGGSLFSYQKKEDAVVEYSKLDGMAEAEISFFRYDPQTKTLVIVYKNQNIDLLCNGVFYNISDFKDKIMTVSKQVNHLSLQNGKAYIATSFGVVIVDLKRREIADTYNLGFNAKVAFEFGNQICIATSGGIQACANDKNPYDIGNWRYVSSLVLNDVVVTDNQLFALNQSQELIAVQPDWSIVSKNGSGYKGLNIRNNLLYLFTDARVDIYDTSLQLQQRFTQASGICGVSLSSDGQIWWVDAENLNGAVRKGDDWQVLQEKIRPDSPRVKDAYDMRFAHGNLYMTTGGPFRIFGAAPGAISVLNEGSWSNITEASMIKENKVAFNKLLDIAVSPLDPGHFMVGSFTYGVFEFKDGKFAQRIYDENGELESLAGKGEHIWASSLNMDDDGNLWVVNSKTDYPLRVRTSEGKWYKYKVGSLNKVEDLYPLMITKHTRNPQKWFLSYYNDMTINVFDENGTFANSADDRSITISTLTDQDGNSYKEVYYRSIVEDNEGRIWLGTSIGPMIISSPENIFTSSGRCTRIKIARNDGTGLADYLLDNVPVICMQVDAANRKWIGTSGNGVYLLSADGLETIHHFTAENSPLPSNEVLSMALDHKSGKLYIGCQGGMVAYQSDAVEGKEDLSNVYAYPNPVYPDYNGVITVTGLMNNTLVKVTDINNNLIYQSNSLGGQFTWDGLNAKGQKVKSGVYLVYGSAEDGSKGVVTKILFIR